MTCIPLLQSGFTAFASAPVIKAGCSLLKKMQIFSSVFEFCDIFDHCLINLNTCQKLMKINDRVGTKLDSGTLQPCRYLQMLLVSRIPGLIIVRKV